MIVIVIVISIVMEEFGKENETRKLIRLHLNTLIAFCVIHKKSRHIVKFIRKP